MRRALPTLLLLGVCSQAAPVANAAEALPLVITHPRLCKPGLYPQPGGAFAALLFCDDAQGSTLGVACYTGIACERAPWELAARFWQQQPWAREVTAFAWDPDGTCLYVSTGEVYGDGRVFALDLLRQKALPLAPKISGQVKSNSRYSTELSRIGGALEYRIQYFDSLSGATRSEVVTVPLGRCGRN
jgi:hypothetical protein